MSSNAPILMRKMFDTMSLKNRLWRGRKINMEENKQIALTQIVEAANHLNDPIEFTSQVAEILRDNELISEATYDILMGRL